MSSGGKKKYSGQCEEAHPEIYTLTAMPDPRTLGKKPGQLSEDKIRQFFEKVRIEFVSSWIFTSGRSNSVISIINAQFKTLFICKPGHLSEDKIHLFFEKVRS